MKLSIWQQWSSNHSAMITIVGEFKSTEAAQKASEELKGIITTISTWNQAHHDELRTTYGGLKPTPIEDQLAAQFDIEWEESIDWLRSFDQFMEHYYEHARCQPEECIIQLDKCVFIDVPGSSMTWQTGHHFVKLIDRLGGEAKRAAFMALEPNTNNDFFFSALNFTLSFTHPDPIKHDQVVQMLQPFIIRSDADRFTRRNIPWAIYHPFFNRITRLTPDEFNRHIPGALACSPSVSLTDMQIREIDYVLHEVSIKFVQLERTPTGTHLTSRTLSNMAFSLPAFVNWLRHEGCCDISYQIHQDGLHRSTWK